MSTKVVGNYVNGQWTSPDGRELLDIGNPSTGEVIGRVGMSTVEDVDVAAGAARSAFAGWSTTPVAKRVAALYALRELIVQIERWCSLVEAD